jgi:death-on-curing family protein
MNGAPDYPLPKLERLTAVRIIAIHEVSVKYGKSFSTGIRDHGSLERLERTIQTMARENAEVSAIVALAMERLVKDHPFWDGNHRTAFELGRFICVLFDKRLDVSAREAIGFMRTIDGSDLPTSQIRKWLEERIVPMKGR